MAGATTSIPFDDEAFGLINGVRAALLMRLACELRIPDLLATSRRQPADLAADLHVLPDPLRRFLRALAALGVVEEQADGSFETSGLGRRFLDEPGSQRAAAIALPNESIDAFREARHSLDTGRPGYEKAFGLTRWEHLSTLPDAAETFQRFMAATSEQMAPALLAAYDFGEVKTAVDVGGGHGALVAAVLAAHPQCEGVLLDLPAAVAGAGEYLDAKGVAARCQVVAGSFFESVPAGADVYLMKFILHDWYDEDCVRILESCRRAMPPGSALLVLDRILPDVARPEALRAFMADVQMLVVVGGRERTRAEFESLFGAAGLELSTTADLSGGVSLLVARPV